MQTDETQPSITGEKHPTLGELKNAASDPHVHEHVLACSMCRSIVGAADAVDGLSMGAAVPPTGSVSLPTPRRIRAALAS